MIYKSSFKLRNFFNKPSPVFIFFLLSCLVNLDSLLGPFRPIRIHDTFEVSIIKLKIYAYLMKSGLLMWDPTGISGSQALISGFHPLNPLSLLCGFLPLWGVYNLWVFLISFTAGYGLFLLLYKSFHLSKFSSYVGGIFFLIFSIPMFPDQVFNYAFPLYVYVFNACFDPQKGKRWKYLLTIFIIMISSVPYLTVPYFPFIQLAIILSCVRPYPHLVRYCVFFAMVWLAYGLIHAPTIYSVISEVPYSHRQEILRSPIAGNLLMVSVRVLMENIRAFPTGFLIPVILAMTSILSFHHKIVRFWWLLLIAIYALVILSVSSPGMNLIKYAGIFKSFSIPRMLEMSQVFIFCLLAACGASLLEGIIKGERVQNLIFSSIRSEKKFKIIFSTISFITIFVFVLVLIHQIPWSAGYSEEIKKKFYIVFTALFLFYFLIFLCPAYSKYRFHPFIGGLLVIGLVFLTKYEFFVSGGLLNDEFRSFNYYFKNKNILAVAERLKEEPLFRAVLNQRDFFHFSPAFLQYSNLETIDGYQPIYPLRYKRLWAQLIRPSFGLHEGWENNFLKWGHRVYMICPKCDGSIGFNFKLLSLYNVKYIFSSYPIKNPEGYGMHLYLDTESDTRIDLGRIENPIDRFRGSFHNYFRDEMFFYVYELSTAFPRAFMVYDWEMFGTEDEILESLSRKSAKGLLEKVLLLNSDLKEITLPLRSKDAKWTSEILEYKPNYIRLSGKTSHGGILVLTDNYHRHWKAFVNGIPSKIFPVYYIFRGVRVPKGQYVVEFKYHDQKLMVAYALVPMGILLLFLAGFILFRKLPE